MLPSKDVIVQTKKLLIEAFPTATVERLGASAIAERHGGESNLRHRQKADEKNGDWRGSNGIETTKPYHPSSQSSFGRYMMQPALLAVAGEVGVGVETTEKPDRGQHIFTGCT